MSAQRQLIARARPGEQGGNRARVLIVDDSALIRQMLSRILASDAGIEVVGVASDPFIARERIKQLHPNVLTLDVEMPRMDGLAFLRNLIRLHPMPVVMVSSLTERGADVTMEALEIGAVDFVSKPKIDIAHTLDDYGEELIAKVKAAARARLPDPSTRPPRPKVAPALAVEPKYSADAVIKRRTGAKPFKTTEQILAIGASTGGTEAIKEVLLELPADAPGTLITQHIPPVFSSSFAARLNELSAMRVCEARDGEPVLRGCAYLAPGDRHLLLDRDGARYLCRLSDGAPVNRHKPSVDVMFRSVAQNAGGNALGVILTGMGDDGASGLLEMREAGAPTVAQDEQSSVVWGMPDEAVRRGAAEKVLPLTRVAAYLRGHLRN